MKEYEFLKQRLAQGWNTWNTRSVLSHVLLPGGLALNLGIKEYRERSYLKETLIGRRGDAVERVVPGRRSYDGRYTELTLHWKGITLRVQSATDGDDLVLLVTPLASQQMPALLVIEGGVLWNRPGTVRKLGERLLFQSGNREVTVSLTQPEGSDPYIPAQTAYLTTPLVGPVGIYTGERSRTVTEIESFLNMRRAEQEASAETFGPLSETYAAMQTCLAWDTVYDPLNDRVISPVSRIWNVGWGGYVLFCWDTYFAAAMAAIDNPDLAYANAIEITRERTPDGFVPNFATVANLKSYDRSQPPVGSLIVNALYRKYGDRWLIETLFDDLMDWNRWWHEHRQLDGLLAWGSNPYEPLADAHFERNEVDNAIGPMMESGLDNSPMWDGVPYDKTLHLQCQQDVGLTGLYVRDCEELAQMARLIDRKTEAAELLQRAETYRANAQKLWNEERGIFCNRRTDIGEFSPRLSPTQFYALLGGIATEEQARRMVVEHLLNPDAFWGEWVLPSISRDDSAFLDQTYWRGRIWAPMNYLVYLGLVRYDLADARRQLVERSQALLLKEWREHGRVCENYSAITGEGGEVRNSDGFYHWGGLLGLIALEEAGHHTLAAVHRVLP